MKITYKGDYSVKVVLRLAIQYEAGVQTIEELASSIDAPQKFLEQILLDLKRGGFVVAKRGQAGGYQLAKPPKEIRLGEVIRFIDGPLEPIACVAKGYAECAETNTCVLRNVWQKVGFEISKIVDFITFEDLVRETKAREKAADYSI